MNPWPSKELERRMLADATLVDENANEGSAAANLCCHLKATLDELRRLQRQEAGWADCIERLAAAGARLTKLAGGAEVADGDMQFTSKEGVFSEEIAQQRIRWLLRCEKSIEAMCGQICSPKITPQQMVADVLGEPAPGRRASR